jgi:HD-GYP domain-containing protein (c-di-GMP phosphodiesterase class II)
VGAAAVFCARRPGAPGLAPSPVGDTARVSAGATQIPLSKVIGALSYALDITEGEPPGHAVRTCMIGMRLAEVLELDGAARSHLFYALLLKDAGCSANSAKMAALFGADDHVAKRTSKRIDWSGRLPAFIWSMKTVAPGGSVRSRLDRLLDIKEEGQVTRALMQARCDRGAEIALLLGLDRETAEAIRALDEHWDGAGQPRGLQGEEIPLLGRILCLAQTAEIFHAAGGFRAVSGVARKRRGGWFDPELVDALRTLGDDVEFWGSMHEGDVAKWEPEERLLLADEVRLDAIASAFAGVVDAKSPWTYRHSDRTSLIVLGLANALGADGRTLRDLRRAALLHDIGKLSISNRILDKPAALTRSEFVQIREHPIVTERILVRVPGCEHLATLAAAHHERLDGGGYPHGLQEEQLTMRMRLLAVADVYEALTSERPYRRALSSDDALAVIRSDVPERLDADVYGALERLLSDGALPERELVDVPAASRRRR